MVIVMEMNSGKPADSPFAYDEEVLNANWLPQPSLTSQPAPQPALQLQVVESSHARRMPPPVDVEAFLEAVYRYQE